MSVVSAICAELRFTERTVDIRLYASVLGSGMWKGPFGHFSSFHVMTKFYYMKKSLSFNSIIIFRSYI